MLREKDTLKWFGQYVSWVLLAGDPLWSNVAVRNSATYEMMLDSNVLSSAMELWVLSELNSREIVDMERNIFLLHCGEQHADLIEKSTEPYGFSGGVRACDILCFS